MPLPKTREAPSRIQIQAVEPIVDCGRFPVKRTVGDRVEVYATVTGQSGQAVKALRAGDFRVSEDVDRKSVG